MDRHAADYDRYHGPDAQRTRKHRLTLAQAALLRRLMFELDRSLVIAPGTQDHPTAGTLKRQGLVTLEVVDAGERYVLTAEGVAEANDRMAETPDDISYCEANGIAPSGAAAVLQAKQRLEAARRQEDVAGGRCSGTPLDDRDLSRLRDVHVNSMDRVLEAEEALREAENYASIVGDETTRSILKELTPAQQRCLLYALRASRSAREKSAFPSGLYPRASFERLAAFGFVTLDPSGNCYDITEPGLEYAKRLEDESRDQKSNAAP